MIYDKPRAGSGVVRIDPLRFLGGYRTRRLNQTLSVLSLSLGFFLVCVLYC